MAGPGKWVWVDAEGACALLRSWKDESDELVEERAGARELDLARLQLEQT